MGRLQPKAGELLTSGTKNAYKMAFFPKKATACSQSGIPFLFPPPLLLYTPSFIDLHGNSDGLHLGKRQKHQLCNLS